jgi:hypothetical protein
MGKYINYTLNGETLPSKGKADFLIDRENALEIPEPPEWKEGIVCVVENGLFDAAAYCFDDEELKCFKNDDGRNRRWLYISNAVNLITD